MEPLKVSQDEQERWGYLRIHHMMMLTRSNSTRLSPSDQHMFAHPRLPAALSRPSRGRCKVVLARHMKLGCFAPLSSTFQALDHFLDRTYEESSRYKVGPLSPIFSFLGRGAPVQAVGCFHMAYINCADVIRLLRQLEGRYNRLVPSFLLALARHDAMPALTRVALHSQAACT